MTDDQTIVLRGTMISGRRHIDERAAIWRPRPLAASCAPAASRVFETSTNETPPMGWAGAFEKVAARRAFVEDRQTQTNGKSGFRGFLFERRNIRAS